MARREVRPRDPLIRWAGRAFCVGRDGLPAVLAHPPRRRDHGDAVELASCRALRCLDRVRWDTEDAGRHLGAGATHGHHGDALSLPLTELRYVVSRTSDATLQ